MIKITIYDNRDEILLITDDIKYCADIPEKDLSDVWWSVRVEYDDGQIDHWDPKTFNIGFPRRVICDGKKTVFAVWTILSDDGRIEDLSERLIDGIRRDLGYPSYRLRKLTGLSQEKFAAKYGIPYRTVQNWETGVSTPPAYVLDLLRFRVEADLAEQDK